MRDDNPVKFTADGDMEMTYVPSEAAGATDYGEGDRPSGRSKLLQRRKGVEVFGAGMEKGGEAPEFALSESDRQGRTHRRKGMRSGSKNTFRRM